MIEEQIKYSKFKQLDAKDPKSQWIENEEYCLQVSTKPSNEFDQEFKIQHQQYLTLKNKRKEEALKKKIEQFGQSSSDQDTQQNKNSIKKLLIEQTSRSSAKKEEKLPEINYGYSHQKGNDSAKKEKEKKYGSQQQWSASKSNKIQILINTKKGSDNWIKQEISINQTSIVFPYSNYPFYDVNKFKLIFTEADQGCFKLKLSWKNQQIIFASSFKQKLFQLPKVYFIFSKIINLKLNLMGKKTASINSSKNDSLPDNILKNSYISGKIVKKLRVISRWSEIFAYVNEKGLFYQKKANDKGELLVQRGSITELWTRFQFQDEFLIIKLFENGHKIELGISVQDFTNTNSWLYHIYSLVFKSN